MAVSYLLQTMFRWRRTIVKFALFSTLVGLAIVLLTPRSYTAVAVLKIDTASTAPVTSGLSRDNYSIESHMELLQSRRLARRVIQKSLPSLPVAKGDTVELATESPEFRELIDDFLGDLSVRRPNLTSLLELRVSDRDPLRATTLVNLLAREHVFEAATALRAKREGTVASIEKQIEESRAFVNQAQADLQKFRVTHGLSEPAPERTGTERRGSRYGDQIATQRAAALSSWQLGPTSKTGTSVPTITAFGVTLDSAKLGELGQSYTEVNKQLRELGPLAEDPDAVAQLQKQANEIRAAYNTLVIDLIDQASDQVTAEIEQLERQERSASDQLTSLIGFLNQARMAQSDQSTEVQIVAEADVPARPSGPSRLLTLLGAIVLGTMAGIGLAFCRETLRKDIRNIDDVPAAQELGEATLLPAVPPSARARAPTGQSWVARWLSFNAKFGEFSLRGWPAHPEGARHGLGALWGMGRQRVLPSPWIVSPDAVEAEPYLNALFALSQTLTRGNHDGPLTVCVVGASRDAGTSMTAVNLATLASMAGLSTLLVDANLRNADATTLYGSDQQIDMSKVSMNFGDVVKSARWGFDLCPARPTDQKGLVQSLSSVRLDTLLSRARKEYELILVDAPSVSDYPDARSFLSLVDVVVLVLKCGHTPIASANLALQQIQSYGGGQICVALNCWDPKEG